MIGKLRTVASAPGVAFGPGQWRTALAAVAAGEDLDYQGVTGKLELDENGDPDGVYLVWTVEGGAYSEVGTQAP